MFLFVEWDASIINTGTARWQEAQANGNATLTIRPIFFSRFVWSIIDNASGTALISSTHRRATVGQTLS
jgi:hypothetical protein